MKIRRKLPKPSRSGRPAYIIGYSSPPPTLPDLQAWFDLEYGGPIRLRTAADAHSSMVLATHGPWTAAFLMSLPVSEADAWRDRLGWGHRFAGYVVPTSTTPHQASNSVLHVARLAKGLSLLTDGTAYDVFTHAYLNPSDWKDRPLEQFRVGDHVTVEQDTALEPGVDWFHTRGLAKFGLDEIETFRPVGLPSRPVMETLARIAEEIMQIGHSPQVGATVPLKALGLSVRVIRHRTLSSLEPPLTLREITWHETA